MQRCIGEHNAAVQHAAVEHVTGQQEPSTTLPGRSTHPSCCSHTALLPHYLVSTLYCLAPALYCLAPALPCSHTALQAQRLRPAALTQCLRPWLRLLQLWRAGGHDEKKGSMIRRKQPATVSVLCVQMSLASLLASFHPFVSLSLCFYCYSCKLRNDTMCCMVP